MIYSSPEFVVAFAVFTLAYWRIGRATARLVVLFVASLLFYAYGEPRGLPLILGVIAFTYAAGRATEAWPTRTRAIVAVSVAVLLANLAFFKDWGFLGGVVRLLPDVIPPVLLPLGISFFTFEAIAYLVDLRRGVTTVERSPLRLGLFIAVFPHLISGPIMRPNGFLPQLRVPVGWDTARFASGLLLFVEGLVKKLFLADLAGGIADRVFTAAGDVGTLVGWTGALAYTVQIYGDFAGYTDMGRGAARMLGLELPLNFRSPYVASSPADFWRRWHISLSSWLRDYLYIALGGNRGGSARTYANLMITMLLGGLWHGAGWTFVLWGGYHGALLVMQRALGGRVRVPVALATAGTFFLVVNGWVLFRARDLEVCAAMLRAMYFPRTDAVHTIGAGSMLFVAAALVATIALMALAERRADLIERVRGSGALAGAGYGLAAGAALVFMLLRGAPTPFIYFRF
ncbi:MAG: hypothetical protein AUH85_13995 [Chloroflexi bacterium 13_1_40CM_4_68_4]|nr:MAG: hypothetical protein AUH85_13995 [Chloroflexi bacterium 13_1_40CM_4_68_4]